MPCCCRSTRSGTSTRRSLTDCASTRRMWALHHGKARWRPTRTSRTTSSPGSTTSVCTSHIFLLYLPGQVCLCFSRENHFGPFSVTLSIERDDRSVCDLVNRPFQQVTFKTHSPLTMGEARLERSVVVPQLPGQVCPILQSFHSVPLDSFTITQGGKRTFSRM